MAGISSASNEMAFASPSPVSDQMKVLLSTADRFHGRRQVQEFIQIGKSGVAMLSKVEHTEINASKDLESWLEKVNAAILMADDVLDECKYHDSLAKDKLWAYISTLGRPSMSSRLKSMNSKLRNALKNGDAFSRGVRMGAPAPDGRSAAAQAMTDTPKLELEFVEYGVGALVDKLLNSDNNTGLSIITLVGWAETGRTALAQLLYKNDDVMFYYDERVWVRVPVDFDADKIANCMSKALNLTTSVADQAAPGNSLVSLRNRLKGKRFLLVLIDAVGLNQTSFRPLKDFLEKLGGFRGSKVLITTGNNPDIEFSFVYHMRLDSTEYCKKLFDKISFADGGPVKTSDLEEISGALVDMCQGNPLYIKLLGSLMYRMKDVSRWRIICEILKGSSSGVIPKLCFNHMSSVPLKRCFQYCYFFPEGSLISREELIELWMAQGYLDLQNRSGPDMEALGRMYYDVLMRSSFFHVSEDDDFDIKSCKIPDVLHGMDSFTELSRNSFKTVVEGRAKNCVGAVHLTLIRCNVKYSKSWKDRFSRLRSLRLENTKGLADFLGCAQGLRVLIVVDASLNELPESISKLIHLRYLDISRTSIVKLPDSISELCNLQTLRLHDLQDKPNNFEKLLVSMMHLYIHKLEDLYEMYEFLSKCGKLIYLSSAKAMLKVFVEKEGKLDNMKELHKLSNRCSTISIHCLENASNDASGITAWLSKIPAGMESLKLNWSVKRENSIDEDVLDKLKPHQSLKNLLLENFKGTTFPTWMMKVDTHISNLVTLELENCSWCEKLPPLGRLSCLRGLTILGMDNLKSISPEFYGLNSSKVFPKLKEFSLRNMSELVDWIDLTPSSTTAFPYLERFEVDQCPKLKGIPDIVLAGEQKCLRKFKVSLCKALAQLPKGLGEAECVEELELFGLPELREFSLGCGSSLKTLIIGCFSDKTEQNDLPKELKSLSSLTNLTIWGYGQKNMPDCFGKLSSLEVLRFESCRSLKNLPQIMSLKELHICYCPILEANCIRGSRPDWPKVSHIKTIVVDNEKIRQPPTVKMP